MTGLAKTNGAALPRPVEMPRSEAIELALVNGDLSGLSVRERWDYYCMRCDAAGLDPRAQPFQFLILNGKLVLYATKAAGDQLIASRRLSVTLISRGYDEETGLYSVHARATFPDGQAVDDLGAVWIMKGEIGEKLANAVLKCVTKAKRRTVLSACGLGMLDESEIEGNPSAIKLTEENTRVIERPEDSGSTHSERVSEAEDYVRSEITKAHDELRAVLAIEHREGEYKPVVKDKWQVVYHIVKEWIKDGVLDVDQVNTSDGKRDRFKCGAAFKEGFRQDPDEVMADVRGYVRGELQKAAEALQVRLLGDADEAQATTDGE